MDLYDEKSTRLLENKLINNGFSGFLMMMRAGNSILSLIKKYQFERIWCISGSGNNGGDALCVAILASINNYDVRCITLDKNKKDSLQAKNLANSFNIKTRKLLPKHNEVRKNDLIVDGLLGIGLSRQPQGKVLQAIKWINKIKLIGATIISIDVPSGLNASTGVAYKQTVCADATMMCLTPKQGCYTGDGIKYCGRLYFNNLGFNNLKNISKGVSYLLKPSDLNLPKRKKNSHKGNFGNVLILGGWDGMSGAGNLAGLAALRVGAGKVFICCENNQEKPNELIKIPVNLEKFKEALTFTDVVVAGPGLGKNADAYLNELWKNKIPIIVDADALRWLAKNFKNKRKEYFVGTPHYGEAVDLLKDNFKDRFDAIKRLKNKFGGNWILKGPGSLIGLEKNYINKFANGILSTAGTGDVLAGILGGLISQNIKEPEKLAVIIHSECAKEIIKEKKETLIASDLIEKISNVMKILRT